MATLLGLALAGLALAGFAPERPDLAGTVTRIIDGDTFVLAGAAGRPLRVRLAEIDAPEHGQPWDDRAKQGLATLILGKPVVVVVVRGDRDRYGRTLGHVRVHGVDVNSAMVRQGHAWAFRAYVRDQRLLVLEREARRAHRGLWSLPKAQQTPPWAWRHGDTPATRSPAPFVSASPARVRSLHAGDGVSRVTGRAFASCRAARAAGAAPVRRGESGYGPHLDRDNDGIGCER